MSDAAIFGPRELSVRLMIRIDDIDDLTGGLSRRACSGDLPADDLSLPFPQTSTPAQHYKRAIQQAGGLATEPKTAINLSRLSHTGVSARSLFMI